MIELAAVFAEPTTRSDLAKGAYRLGQRVEGRAPSAANLLPVLESLTARGFLVGYDHWAVTEALADHVVRALVKRGDFVALAALVREIRPLTRWPRDLWLALHEGAWDTARALLAASSRPTVAELLRRLPLDMVRDLPPDLRAESLGAILRANVDRLEPAEEALALLETTPQLSEDARALLAEQLLLRGRLDDAERTLAAASGPTAVAGWLLAARGRWDEAVTTYEAALKAYARVQLATHRKRARFLPGNAGAFFVVALIASGKPAARARAQALAEAAQRGDETSLCWCYAAFIELIQVLEHQRLPEEMAFAGSSMMLPQSPPVRALLLALAASWARRPATAEVARHLEAQAGRARDAGYTWLAAQYAAVLLAAGAPDPEGRLASLRQALSGPALAEALARRERWEEALDALLVLASSGAPAEDAKETGERRLVWLLTQSYARLDLEPREQTRSRGGWSKGRPVALARLYAQGSGLHFLTSADRAACRAISETIEGRYADVYYHLDVPRALAALAGQPNVLVEVKGAWVPVEIRTRLPSLRARRLPSGGFQLTLDVAPARADERLRAERIAPNLIELVPFSDLHHQITTLLGRSGMELPPSAEPRLRALVAKLSHALSVEADLEVAREAGPSLPPDPRPHAILRRLGEGLSVALVVRPLGPLGPSAQPGHGGAAIAAELAGRSQTATRDLAEEARLLEELRAACPTLPAARFDLVLPERDRALQLLGELRAAGDGVVLEWPDGEALRVSAPASLEQLVLSLAASEQGFEATGHLEVPGHDPLALTTLLDYVAASPGAFVPLAEQGSFLALTAELRERLAQLAALGEPSPSGRRFHRLLAPELDRLLGSAALGTDAAWRAELERFAPAGPVPRAPPTLRGELRPYQEDGFTWLARLARWGAGACLADDMGLGKTIQVIALLLLEAPKGPSLVVAPTSLLPNWTDELARFAPTLRVRLYAGAHRAGLLDGLGPFDLVLTSYALLQQDADQLAAPRFAVALLDEAQAIKNARTQRARAALRLQAEVRVATTGTPIENRLEELWSLFHFLNPGLLGSAERFEQRFARPIERDGDARAREHLRRLIAPFILRRTKTAVLAELPPKTETTLRVELELDELALYEVLRDEALAELSRLKSPAKRRFHLLAALTRLRRAACNTRLILPERETPSAKLTALGELLDELLPRGHKALIFSQFVDHLGLVRELLEARGVAYAHLDGSTSLAQRKLAVDTFQAGEADVFLISLKAGGFGLNLTAADYVIHLDPWWNPAAEDQASDRAHRIGQDRPVMVYRLVAKDTIEDRIVALHHRKRDLAAAVLKGTEVAGRLAEEELLALIRGQ